MNLPVYRGFTREALDAAYDNRSAVAQTEAWRERWAKRSEGVYATRRCDRDLAYGRGARQRLDYFYADRPGRPTIAFLHGGYWQRNDKEGYACMVEGLLTRGCNAALIEYTLAPFARMDQIVGEMKMWIAWLKPQLVSRFGASDRLVVAGHSAGGHLTGISMEHPGVAGGVLISGIFDLEPIRLSRLNDALCLGVEEVQKNSPMYRSPRIIPALVGVGGAELPELIRQSREYTAYLNARGNKARELVLEGEDHFSVLEHLANPDGAIARACLDLAGGP